MADTFARQTTIATAPSAELLLRSARHIAWEGFERSFKIRDRWISWDRFLFGSHTNTISQEAVLRICDQIQMPEDYRKELITGFAEANGLGFGYEASGDSCIYKVYLEFWDKVRRKVRSEPGATDPALLHLGFKWDPMNSARRIVTKYTCYPRLTTPDILGRLRRFYHRQEQSACFGAVKAMISLASAKAPHAMFLYVEVNEENSHRDSYDLNLYKAGMDMAQLHPCLSAIRKHYSIAAEAFEPNSELVEDKLFGHIAGGLDRDGHDFVTVYYEEETPIPAPRLQATTGPKVGRNEPCPCGSGKKYKKCCGR